MPTFPRSAARRTTIALALGALLGHAQALEITPEVVAQGLQNPWAVEGVREAVRQVQEKETT